MRIREFLGRRSTKIGFGVAVLAGVPIAAWLAFGYFGVHKLFVDDKVDEELTVFVDDDGDEGNEGNPDTTAPEDGPGTPEPTDPPATEAVPIRVASGSFSGSGSYSVEGEANLIRNPDGTYLLQFPDLRSDNGPDLVVYLSEGGSTDADHIVDLGRLKGNIGNQEYEVPVEFEPDRHDTVLIWCRRFTALFGDAPLNPV